MNFHSESEVRSVKEPYFTDSWHPISHGKIIDSVEKVVEEKYAIKKRDYSLTKNGGRMFAAWTLENDKDGTNLMLGFRNSIDKSLSTGFCSGSYVTVCSNMAFDGEFVEFKKHTIQMSEELLSFMAKKVLSKFEKKAVTFIEWQDSLKNYVIKEKEFKELTFDAMKKDILKPSKFISFLDCYNDELALNGDTLYTFHGSCTRFFKNYNLFQISNRSKSLNNFLNEYIKSNKEGKK